MRFHAILTIGCGWLVTGTAALGHEEVKNPNPPVNLHSPMAFGLPKSTGGPDGFGYVFRDNAEGIDFDFVDISGSGTLVMPPVDDGSSGPVTLGAPFFFYGEVYTELVMASNGYISTNSLDTGGDFTSDCPLPMTPSTGGGGRIYPLHDDLVVNGGGYYQFFPASPIPGHDGGSIAQPASIFMWDNVTHFEGGGETWDMEVVLFHTTSEVFIMIGAGNPEMGAASTTGIQNDGATVGLTYACFTPGSAPNNLAVAIELDSNALSAPFSLNVPFFRDTAAVPGFIGIKNVTAADVFMLLLYTQIEDQGGGNFQPVVQTPKFFGLGALSSVSWRPVQNTISEGAGQSIPNAAATSGLTPPTGSAQLVWYSGGASAIQGRYVEVTNTGPFSFVLPRGT